MIAGADLGLARVHALPGFAVSGVVRSSNFGAGVAVYPAKKMTRRLDPVFGLKLGYSRTRLDGAINGIGFEETVNRGGVRLFGAMLLHVSSMVRIGPRFDVTIPFAGTMCLTARLPEETIDECSTVREQGKLGFSTQELPIHWDLLLDLQIVIPARRRAAAGD